MADIITYEALYEILRQEKFKTELQKLDPEFFPKVVDYLKNKRELLEEQPKSKIFSAFEAQKSRRQLENIQKILKEIYERRECKIIELALFCSRTEDSSVFPEMLPEEKLLFDNLKKNFDSFRNDLLFSILSCKIPSIVKKEPEKTKKESKLVRFVQAVPKFVGTDMNIYGPFEEEDMASLPDDVASIIVKNKRAEFVKVKI